MNYQDVNQQQQGNIGNYSAHQSYQQPPGYGGNTTVQQHQHDAQGSSMSAGTDGGRYPGQVINRDYAQQQQLLSEIPTTKEMGSRPTQLDQKPPKKRAHINPKPRKTAPETAAAQSTDMLTAPIIDVVASGKERRRTQMRLAQRAYRQRKQNELSSRVKQVSERDEVIARMKAAFNLLQSRLMEVDALSVNLGLEGPMAEMEMGFEALGQMATDSGSTSAPAPVPTVGGGQADMPAIETVVDASQQRQWSSSDLGSDNSDPYDLLNQPRHSVYGTTAPAQTFDMQHHYSNTYQQYTNQTVPITTMNEISLPIGTYISPPTSYSFQETTFARRLMRICIERAHQVLIRGGLATLSPGEARVFKLAYRVWSRDYLVQKFQMALAGTSDLYDPSVPFVPLGGAGTHYVHLRESPPPNSQSMASSSSSNPAHYYSQQQPHLPTETAVTSGPLTTHMAHIPHTGPDTSIMGIVSSLGLLNDGSEWFDVQDIEGYLLEMGIKLEPHLTTYRFLVPANPSIASKRTVMNEDLLAGVFNQSADGNMLGQDYVPAYVDVDMFISGLSSFITSRIPWV